LSQKKVLGRGLGALIPKTEAPPPAAPAPNEVDIDQIETNPYQPRKHFDPVALEELARSVVEHGVVQPLVVVRHGEKYQLIAGERRFRAARKAGLKRVPVVVKDPMAGSKALEIALIENVQREDLNPIEEAVAYQQLNQEFGMTQEEVAKKVGKERSTVANFLRLLKLPDRVKTMVAGGDLSMGHARALLAVEGARQIETLAEKVVRQGLNVRQTEQLASAGDQKKKEPAGEEETKDVFTRDAEEKLTSALRAKVEIARKRRGGVISIRFGNEDDLMRLYEELSSRGRR
jgi:ParB family transcriptional regulator, chromosome partitioning protein